MSLTENQDSKHYLHIFTVTLIYSTQKSFSVILILNVTFTVLIFGQTHIKVMFTVLIFGQTHIVTFTVFSFGHLYLVILTSLFQFNHLVFNFRPSGF